MYTCACTNVFASTCIFPTSKIQITFIIVHVHVYTFVTYILYAHVYMYIYIQSKSIKTASTVNELLSLAHVFFKFHSLSIFILQYFI